MTRTLTLRVPDELYDFVIERAILHDGDLSEATRDALDAAQMLYGIVESRDPHGALQEILDETKKQAARDAYFDEMGYYPGEATHED